MRILLHLNQLLLKLVWTIVLIYCVKLGSLITLPGLRRDIWENAVTEISVNRISLVALYLSPYILTNLFVFFFLSRVKAYQKWREESPHQALLLTQVLTLVLSFFHAIWNLSLILNENLICDFQLIEWNLENKKEFMYFNLHSILFFILGTTLLQWMAHLITKKGLGNGISFILITTIWLEFSSSSLAEKGYILFKDNISIFFILVLSFFSVSFYLIHEERNQTIPFLPTISSWETNYLKSYFRKNITELGGGRDKLYFIHFSIQSIGFLALIFSNLLQFFLNPFLVFLEIKSNVFLYFLIEFTLDLYLIWISILLVVWFFCVIPSDYFKDYIYKAFNSIHPIPDHPSAIELAQWIWIQSHLEIKRLFFYLSILKLGPFLILSLIFLFDWNVLGCSISSLSFLEYRNRLSVIFFILLRIFYSIGKQLQNKYWREVSNK